LPEAVIEAPAALEHGTLRLPARIHVGYGSREQLPRIAAELGTRVFAVVDPFLVGSPLLDAMVAALREASLEVVVYSDVVPELPVESLTPAAEALLAARADVVLALGGGSALDAAKLIALLAAHGGPLSRYYGENLVPGPVLPLVAMPTTAGTGSEATPVAVVTDPERELKVGVSSPHLVPVAAIVDPEFAVGSPASVTAFSGVDALVHLAESFTARTFAPDWSAPLPVFTGRNALIEPFALRGARHLGQWLEVAVREPLHREARLQVAIGALYGGMAFGPTGTHLCHALQYPIGALTHTPHGLGTGLLLPYALDVLRADPAVAAHIAAFGAALEGIEPAEASAERTVRRVAEIAAAIGVPRTLAELGLTRDQLPRIAELGMASARLAGISPVPASPELMLEVLERAFAGSR
jgi:alcohol dehydrogenase